MARHFPQFGDGPTPLDKLLLDHRSPTLRDLVGLGRRLDNTRQIFEVLLRLFGREVAVLACGVPGNANESIEHMGIVLALRVQADSRTPDHNALDRGDDVLLRREALSEPEPLGPSRLHVPTLYLHLRLVQDALAELVHHPRIYSPFDLLEGRCPICTDLERGQDVGRMHDPPRERLVRRTEFPQMLFDRKLQHPHLVLDRLHCPLCTTICPAAGEFSRTVSAQVFPMLVARSPYS